MTFAAKTGSNYHLWWHPHNFGKDLEANLKFLEKILQHYIIFSIFLNFNLDCLPLPSSTAKSSTFAGICLKYVNNIRNIDLVPLC